MKLALFILAVSCFGINASVGQKIIEKQFFTEDITTLSIEDNAIFKITVYTSEEKEIKFSAHISGEHSENVIIEENFSEGKLSLKTGFAPFFVLNNDKLAAHKLMAIEVKLIVPETLSLEIKSKLASVAIDGTIKNLAVSLQRGNCFAINFSGNAHLKTTDGTITVYAADAVGGKAISTRGKIENNLPPNGKFFIEAESINGNIRMLQTK